MSEEKKYEQQEKSGALFIDSEAQILRKGSVLWEKAQTEDEKDDKRYFALIESENNLGKKKIELVMSVGLVFVNNNKIAENSPDISGGITIDGIGYKFYGRKKETKDGQPFTQIKLVEKDEDEENKKLPF